MKNKTTDLPATKKYLLSLLKPEANFFAVAIVYSIVISLLTLAVPFAVQTLINTIANIASGRALAILASLLFVTLALYGIFSVLRLHIMEYYSRKIYVRLTTDIGLHTLFSSRRFFEGHQNISMTHYYYEIMTIQRNLPTLFIDGFALLLQMLVGIVLVSFYHPSLLAFNLILLLALYFAWRLWSNGGKRNAIALSRAKYTTGQWFNEMAMVHHFFSSTASVDYARKLTDRKISEYIDKHTDYYFFTFYQHAMFLFIFAVASSALLGLGGWLVIQGQMSIGQLVAAELIMSAVFFGLSRFSRFLELYYQLYGAADKIAMALSSPQEDSGEQNKPSPQQSNISFNGVLLKHGEEHCFIDLKLKAEGKYYLPSRLQKELSTLLTGTESPDKGWISMGDLALSDYDIYGLREAVKLVDDSLIMECSIRDFLLLSAPEATDQQLLEVLKAVEILHVIDVLPENIDTVMTLSGYPLKKLDFLLLKVAATLLSEPKVILVGRQFNLLELALRERISEKLSAQRSTVLYFSDTPDLPKFDGALELEAGSNHIVMKPYLVDAEGEQIHD